MVVVTAAIAVVAGAAELVCMSEFRVRAASASERVVGVRRGVMEEPWVAPGSESEEVREANVGCSRAWVGRAGGSSRNLGGDCWIVISEVDADVTVSYSSTVISRFPMRFHESD